MKYKWKHNDKSYIPVPRALLKASFHPKERKEPYDEIVAFLDILSWCNNPEPYRRINGQCFELEQGQCIVTFSELAKKWHLKNSRQARWYIDQWVKHDLISTRPIHYKHKDGTDSKKIIGLLIENLFQHSLERPPKASDSNTSEEVEGLLERPIEKQGLLDSSSNAYQMKMSRPPKASDSNTSEEVEGLLDEDVGLNSNEIARRSRINKNKNKVLKTNKELNNKHSGNYQPTTTGGSKKIYKNKLESDREWEELTSLALKVSHGRNWQKGIKSRAQIEAALTAVLSGGASTEDIMNGLNNMMEQASWKVFTQGSIAAAAIKAKEQNTEFEITDEYIKSRLDEFMDGGR